MRVSLSKRLNHLSERRIFFPELLTKLTFFKNYFYSKTIFVIFIQKLYSLFFVKFGYRFGAIISPKSRRINCLQLITSLEIIGSLSTDAKWLSWLKYQFTAAIKKKPTYQVDPNNNNNDVTNKEGLFVTLEDFKENFYLHR